MPKVGLIGVILSMVMTVPCLAQGLSSDWKVEEYKTMQVEMATATDKAGHKMHILRMNGALMAVVPASPLLDLMKTSPDFMWQ